MILVTGATGLIGRHLVDVLAAQGTELRTVTRDRPPDFDGVEAVFLHPRAVPDPVDFLAVARAHRVRKVVVLSAMNVDDPLEEQPSRAAGDRNKEAEDAAVASGLRWTSLRPSTFADNTRRAFAPAVRAGDVVRYVYPAFEESPIDERDLAAVAAHALVTDDLLSRRVQLTGPHSLSHAAMVSIIGSVLGRPLRFEEIPPETALRAMAAAGLPEPFLTGLMARYARHLDRPQHPANAEVASILHRPALTYAEWVTAHADTFRH